MIIIILLVLIFLVLSAMLFASMMRTAARKGPFKTKCPHCDEIISDRASHCPYCAQPTWEQRPSWIEAKTVKGRKLQGAIALAVSVGILLLIAAAALLAAVPAHAAEPGRDMTCRGSLEGPSEFRMVGETCYIDDPAAAEIVNAACQSKLPCVVRARVVGRDTPTGMPRAYTVVKVYSARNDVPLPRARAQR